MCGAETIKQSGFLPSATKNIDCCWFCAYEGESTSLHEYYLQFAMTNVVKKSATVKNYSHSHYRRQQNDLILFIFASDLKLKVAIPDTTLFENFVVQTLGKRLKYVKYFIFYEES
jgi:hypothetical protein